jgi:mRNA-capping enzyme
VRTDKDAPNFVTVYRHTLASILDDITDSEIIGYVGDILRKGAGGNKAAPDRKPSGGEEKQRRLHSTEGNKTADETAEPLGVAGGYESTAPAAHVSGAERQQPVIDDI